MSASIAHDSISGEKEVEPVIIVPETKTVPDASRSRKLRLKKRVEASGTARSAVKKATGPTTASRRQRHRTVKEKILNLKDEGLTEDEVADRLGISIYAVNKYWDD